MGIFSSSAKVYKPATEVNLGPDSDEFCISSNVKAPWVAGLLVKIFVWILEMPIISQIVLYILKKDNLINKLPCIHVNWEELEENFPGHEWITPQSSVRAAYQSQTEKGIRKICSELLELKDAIENLCGNMQSKYHAFLRISEEVVEAEQELTELQKHVSAQGILVQDLMSGVCRELEMWQKYSKDEHVEEKDFQTELNEIWFPLFLTIVRTYKVYKVAKRFLAAVKECSSPSLSVAFFISYSPEDIMKQAEEFTLWFYVCRAVALWWVLSLAPGRRTFDSLRRAKRI